jgi:hypothetical protein
VTIATSSVSQPSPFRLRYLATPCHSIALHRSALSAACSGKGKGAGQSKGKHKAQGWTLDTLADLFTVKPFSAQSRSQFLSALQKPAVVHPAPVNAVALSPTATLLDTFADTTGPVASRVPLAHRGRCVPVPPPLVLPAPDPVPRTVPRRSVTGCVLPGSAAAHVP